MLCSSTGIQMAVENNKKVDEVNQSAVLSDQLRPTAFPAEEDVRQRKPLYKGEQQFNSRNKVIYD